MLPLGILSIIQAFLLPGILISLLIKNLRDIDRVLLAIPLSIVVNYAQVLFLTLTSLYSRYNLFPRFMFSFNFFQHDL